MSGTARVACFGEILLRLSAPDREPLLCSPRLDARFGGAEANVAVSLARLGSRASMIGVLPDNPLGHAALDEVRRRGVETTHIGFVPGRMGLYFLAPGAVLRPSEILYDRAASAFAETADDLVDWPAALADIEWLHISGVTPAVGAKAAVAARHAAVEARSRGVKFSFDGNYRAKLWGAWAGDGPAILRSLLAEAELAFVNERDIGLIVGRRFDDGDPVRRFRDAAMAAFAQFPNLRRIARTNRVQHAVGRHDLSASLITREAEFTSRTFHLDGIVDRIGAGDAFAAGLLHALMAGMDDRHALDFALAACCLKHSFAGDVNLAGEADVLALLTEGNLDVRR